MITLLVKISTGKLLFVLFFKFITQFSEKIMFIDEYPFLSRKYHLAILDIQQDIKTISKTSSKQPPLIIQGNLVNITEGCSVINGACRIQFSLFIVFPLNLQL